MMFNKVYLGATPISKIFLGDVPIKYGNNIVAIYTVNDINKTSPTLVVGKADDWKETVKDNGDGTYTVTITTSRGPTKISFENNTSLLSVDYLNYRNITDMSDMFYNCTNLQTLHLDNWSYDSIGMIINVSSLPINDIGTIKSIHCKKEEADGLIAPENWEFSYAYNTIAKYTVDNKQKTSPTSVSGKADDWEETVVDNGNGTYTVTITASYGPTGISFSHEPKNVHDDAALLTVEYIDTSNITNMSHMFYGCYKLTSINIRNWNTSQVTNMSGMFYKCYKLTSLDLSKFDTSNVTSMYGMFAECNLSFNISNWDTSKVTNMTGMFYGCDVLESLDLSGWDTSKVTNMRYMFYECYNLTTLDVRNWDTGKVTDMSYMFLGCNKLESLDLSSWRTSQVTYMGEMFHGCNSLTSLDLSNWSINNTNQSYMFTNCNKLESLYLTNCDYSTVYNIVNMHDFPRNKIDGAIRTIHCKYDSAPTYTPTNWIYSFMLYDLVAIYTVNDSSKTSPDLVEGKAADWRETVVDNGDGTYKVTITASYGPTRIRFNSNNIDDDTTLLSVDYIDTSNMTSMNKMFSKCIELTSVNASNFDTSNVTDMRSMFFNCKSLKSLDVSNFNTDQVTDMESMFCNCDSLTSLDLSNWNTSQVTNMSGMFCGCDSLTSLDVSRFDTRNVTTMEEMFYACPSLTSLDLSSFDTSNVKNMYEMFYECTLLSILNLSNFNTSNVTKMNSMLYSCNKLRELRLDNCSNDTISKIITPTTSLPTNVIGGVTKTIYCKEENAAGLTIQASWNWVFSYVS